MAHDKETLEQWIRDNTGTPAQIERYRLELAQLNNGNGHEQQALATAAADPYPELPAELKALHQWVLWRYEYNKKGDMTKVPYTTSKRLASSTNPATWSTYAEVCAMLENVDGIGIVFANGLAGCDLDHHVTDGQPDDFAQTIVGELNTYTEYSPSETGLHLLFWGKLPGAGKNDRERGIEIYDHARYFTVTGKPFAGCPATVEERTEAATRLYNQLWPAQEEAAPVLPAQPVSVDDNDLLEKIRASKQGMRFFDLWQGGECGYPSLSEADLAFCNMLAFWTGRDAARMDSLFRSSSRMRDKWDRPDYVKWTIGKAISGTTEIYNEPMPYPTSADLGPLPDDNTPLFDDSIHPFLTRYLKYSIEWSPRSPLDFHIASALFVLSTVAARRIGVHFGGLRYPSLYMAMVAWSSVHAKTTAAALATDLIRTAGLDFLLAQDNATPQKFIFDLTEKYPANYDKRDDEGKIRARHRLAFAGKRGWFYGEFGQHMAAMMQPAGMMADFRGLMRAFDDGLAEYEYGSISRGDDVVKQPYLALFASMTIDDIRPFAKKGSALWGDGFLARFGLITPKTDRHRSRAQFPDGERRPPAELMQQLQAWHKRLGERQVHIIETAPENKGKPAEYEVRMDPFITQALGMPAEVKALYYAYDNALLDLIENAQNHDLDGNYSRFPEKALRIALLLASVEGRDEITAADWMAARAITERWRAGLHELYRQVNAGGPSKEREEEEKVLAIIARLGNPTRREIGLYTKYDRSRITAIIAALLENGDIEAREEGKTTRYSIAGKGSVENEEQ